MSLFRLYANELMELAGLRYNPERHALPAPPAAPKKARERRETPAATVHIVDGQRFFERTPAAESVISEWERETTEQNSGRIPALTSDDLAALGALDVRKAGAIKPLWAAGHTNEDCSKILTARLGKGFSPRTVSNFTAAFSRANNETT